MIASAATDLEVAVEGPAGPLAATFTVPEGVGPFPGVVLVSGSGPLDRDSDHKKLRFGVSRQLATALAAAGVASLRFDKRGVGASRRPGEDWRAVGLADNADDVAAAVEALRARPEVRDDAVLLVGHSEGAVLACKVAGGGVPLAGVGLLAGSARQGRDLLRWQASAITPTLPPFVRGLLRLLRVDLEAKVSKNHAKLERTTTDVARVGGARLNAKWFREFLAYDPSADLTALADRGVAVLAVTGSKDLQSPPEDAHRIGELAGRPTANDVEVHLLADVTHTLRRQPGPPSLSRYKREVREPVAPEVVDAVVRWAVRVTADVT